MKRTLVLLLLCLMALVGCSSIDSGTITKKVYTAPYETTEYTCISRDTKTQTCKAQMPRQVHHSAAYKFDLKKNDKTGWVFVNEHDYNKYQVGDCWAC